MITTIKQYGEIRTGTNYLRALIQRNYPDIQVLSYILGNKHSPPVPFDSIWQQAQTGPDTAFNFVSTSTFRQRGGASHPKDPNQRQELIRRAPGIARAYETGALGFLITIKDPYAWIVSAAKFNGWIRDNQQLQDWSLDMMRDACVGYNRNYREWISFVKDQHPRARIIRYEDLMADPEQILTEIAAQFGWRRSCSFQTIEAVVEPTQWDNQPVVEAPETFCSDYYANKKYLQFLPDKQLQLIGDLIEWDQLGDYGYVRLL